LSRRWRSTRYGAAAATVLVGVACGATLPGALGGTLATVLIGIGLVCVLSLIFYEVGLSEDRDRSRRDLQARRSEKPAPPAPPAIGNGRSARVRSLDRSRGERRRLR
jgi:fatty acid desaturase